MSRRKLRRRRTSRGAKVKRNGPKEYSVVGSFSRVLSTPEWDALGALIEQGVDSSDWWGDEGYSEDPDVPAGSDAIIVVHSAREAQRAKNVLLGFGQSMGLRTAVKVRDDDGERAELVDPEDLLPPLAEVTDSEARRRASLEETLAFVDDLEENGSPDDKVFGAISSALESNPRARALGDRPSMDTGFFGDDLDDEEIDGVSGTEAKHLDEAMRRYQTFHAKAPIRITELTHDLPQRWKEVGDALAVMYRTDKWKKDGKDEDYKHLHDESDGKAYEPGKGVRIYEPVRGSGGQKLPVSRPQALTLLGYCLGVFVRKDDDGDIYEANPRGCYLFSSPSGDMLFVYSPHKQSDGSSGFIAALAGGKLRVLKDGIDG